MPTGQDSTLSDKLAFSSTARAQIVRNLSMSPDADQFLADLARETGLSEGGVLRLALVLFKAALDAKQQGKHVGITQNPDALDIELVGF